LVHEYSITDPKSARERSGGKVDPEPCEKIQLSNRWMYTAFSLKNWNCHEVINKFLAGELATAEREAA
jgi:hypothetical protein